MVNQAVRNESARTRLNLPRQARQRLLLLPSQHFIIPIRHHDRRHRHLNRRRSSLLGERRDGFETTLRNDSLFVQRGLAETPAVVVGLDDCERVTGGDD